MRISSDRNQYFDGHPHTLMVAIIPVCKDCFCDILLKW
jgi:hypothetical protein